MKRIIVSLILVTVMLAARSYAFDYVINQTKYPYSIQAQPAKNTSYVDTTFHTTVTRVSDKAIDNYTGARLITGYSTFSGVSSDGKYIVLMMCDAAAKYALYNAATNTYVKDLGLQSWNGDPEPRWDGSGNHPSWLYFVRFGKLMRMDVDSTDPLGTAVTVHDFTADFPACYYIKNDEEGDCSADSRYWIFELRDVNWRLIRIVTYDMQTNTIMGSLTSFPYAVNCVSVSPNGKYFLVDWQFAPHGTNSGPKVYNRDFSLACPSEVKNDATHWCWATLPNGHTAVVSQNNGTNYGGTQQALDAIQVFDIESNSRSYIMYQKDMGWNSGFHFFNTGKPGWAGMYVISAPNDPNHSYWDYDQIYLMELKDNGRVFRVTFSQHKYTGDYFDEGHAQMDWHRTGTKLWFNANWRGTDNAEVYRVDLPANWYEELSGVTPADRTPPRAAGYLPAKGATGVAPDSNISVQVLDDSSGVNLASVVLKVNGTVVYNGISPTSYPNTSVIGSSMSYTLTYDSPANFPGGKAVTVTIDAADFASPPNVMAQDSCSFTVRNDTRTITGYTRDVFSNPLSGVNMVLSGGATQTITTDASGLYRYPNLTAGLPYTVTPNLPGYSFAPTSRSTATLTNNLSSWDFAGTPFYYIKGYVRDSGGYGISGATVTLTGNTSGSVSTGSDGSYQFLNLAGGKTYTVTPTKSGYNFTPLSISTASLSTNWDNRNFTGASSVYYLKGYVRSAGGAGISGVSMTLSGSATQTTLTADDGLYQFPALAANGTYTVTPAKAGFSFAPLSVSTASLSANWDNGNFTGTPLYHIKGYVRDAGGVGISSVTVTLSGGASRVYTTTGDGHYEFLSVSGNSGYTITPAKTGLAFAPVVLSTASLNANWDNGNFTGTSFHSIKGYVRDGNGVGVSSVTVTLSGGASRVFITAGSGYYEFLNVPGNNGYTVTPTKAGSAFTPAALSTASLSANWDNGNFIATGPTLYYIRGYVRSSTGAGVAGVTMTLSGNLSRSTITSSDGAYQFLNLAGNANYAVTPSKTGTQFTPQALNVTGLQANLDNQNFAAVSLYFVSGYIRDARGGGIDDVAVKLC